MQVKSNKAACSPLWLKALTREDTTKVKWKRRREHGAVGCEPSCSWCKEKSFLQVRALSIWDLGQQEDGNQGTTIKGLQSNQKTILQEAFMACSPHWHRQVLGETASPFADCEDIHGKQETRYPQAEAGGEEGANSRDQVLPQTTSWWPYGQKTLQLERPLKNL